MYLRIIAKTLAMILLLTIQVSFVSALPGWLSYLNVVLVVLILILGFVSFRSAIIWALVVGLLWDIYSFAVFGVYVFSLVLSLMLANFLLENFLTNRSLYTFLALNLVSVILFELLVYLISFVYSMLSGEDFAFGLNWHFLESELMKIVVNLGLTFLLFYIISFFSKRFKPMFLLR